MKKFLSLFLAVLIGFSLLASGALAKSGGGNQSAGAPGQHKSDEKPDKGNNGKGSENGKGNAGNQGQSNQKSQGDPDGDGTRNGNGEANGQRNGDPENRESRNPQFYRQGNPNHIQAIADVIGELTDSELASKLNDLLTAYKDAKPGQDAQDAWTALLDALEAAGVSLNQVQPVRRWWTEQQGKPIDVDAVITAIGQLTDRDAATKLNALLLAYQEAEVGKAVHEALTALLDAMKAAGVEVDIMQPPTEDGETSEPDKPVDIEAIIAAINQLTDSAVASHLSALVTAYQEAVTAGEDAVQAALTALLDALKAAGITEGIA